MYRISVLLVLLCATCHVVLSVTD
ncbi:hypothetical protein CISIN_1g0399091mg, partial [Citrus sinensis]